MDVVVNSQVQSPLVRTLESINAKGASFTHNIPDNVPPLSMNRVVIPMTPSSGLTNGNWYQSLSAVIPQYGTLQKVVIRYTAVSNPDVNGQTTPKMLFSSALSPGFGLTETVVLKTRNRPIQTVYGREAYANALHMSEAERNRQLEMADWHVVKKGGQYTASSLVPSLHYGTLHNRIALQATDIFGHGFTVNYNNSGFAENLNEITNPALVVFPNSESTCYFEVPLASTIDPAHAFNTRFVEPLTLQLQISGFGGGVQAITDGLDEIAAPNPDIFMNPPYPTLKVDALCYFINFHDLTEQDIRNANYRPDAPAVVFGYDTFYEQPESLNLIIPASGAEANTAHVSIAPTPEKKITVPLRCNNLVYRTTVLCTSDTSRSPNDKRLIYTKRGNELHYHRRHVYTSQLDGILSDILGSSSDVAQSGLRPTAATFRYERCLPYFTLSNVRLTGSGQVLYDGSSYETQCVDVIDQSLSTYTRRGCLAPPSTLLACYLNTSGDSVAELGQCFNICRVGTVNAAILRYGLTADETYNSGSLGLQTIAAPTIVVTIPAIANYPIPNAQQLVGGIYATPRNIHVYHRYHCLIQIDSGTGAITRSIDA